MYIPTATDGSPTGMTISAAVMQPAAAVIGVSAEKIHWIYVCVQRTPTIIENRFDIDTSNPRPKRSR